MTTSYENTKLTHLFVLSNFIVHPSPIITSFADNLPATPTPPDTFTAPVDLEVEAVVLVNEVAPVTVPPDSLRYVESWL